MVLSIPNINDLYRTFKQLFLFKLINHLEEQLYGFKCF